MYADLAGGHVGQPVGQLAQRDVPRTGDEAGGLLIVAKFVEVLQMLRTAALSSAGPSGMGRLV